MYDSLVFSLDLYGLSAIRCLCLWSQQLECRLFVSVYSRFLLWLWLLTFLDNRRIVTQVLEKLFYRGRHYKVCVIVTAQYIKCTIPSFSVSRAYSVIRYGTLAPAGELKASVASMAQSLRPQSLSFFASWLNCPTALSTLSVRAVYGPVAVNSITHCPLFVNFIGCSIAPGRASKCRCVYHFWPRGSATSRSCLRTLHVKVPKGRCDQVDEHLCLQGHYARFR